MIFTDSNILIDIIEEDPNWCDWSQDQLAMASGAGPVVINHLVLAEVAPYSGDLSHFLHTMDIMGIRIEPICSDSAYAAGSAFKAYRSLPNRPKPSSILPDFLIGGHAQHLGAAILTRDPRFYRKYFPSVSLITPPKE